jgi:hypothetical protein
LAAGLLALLATAANAAAPAPVTGGLSAEQRQLVIEKAYGRLAELIATSGSQVSIGIAKPRTLEVGEFAGTSWLQVVTMPGGAMLDVAREERRNEGAVTAILYRPSWKLDAKTYLDTAEGQRLRGLSVADVLAIAAVDNADFGRVEAITSYRVTIKLQGRTRAYRAAALWLAEDGVDHGRVVFVDHVTQGVADAALVRRLRPGAPRSAPVTAKTDSCVAAENWNNQFQTSPLDPTGHVWLDNGERDGFHYGEGEAKFACSCASDCRSTCTSSFNWTVCADMGETIDGCHVMGTNTGTGTTSKPDGLAGGASCAAGLGCVKKSCTFCMCSPGISVSVSGMTVNFTSSGSPDWSHNLSYQFTCNACIPTATDPPGGGGGGDIHDGPLNRDPYGGGGSGGGGGGGGCCWWRTSCYTDSAGVYQCTISSCGQWGC